MRPAELELAVVARPEPPCTLDEEQLEELGTWPNGPDWNRLEREVLAPLTRDTPAEFVAKDWATMRLNHRRSVQPGGIVIVEGIGSAASKPASYLRLAIWVECPQHIRFNGRSIADREGVVGASRHWSQWEKRYLAADDLRPHAMSS